MSEVVQLARGSEKHLILMAGAKMKAVTYCATIALYQLLVKMKSAVQDMAGYITFAKAAKLIFLIFVYTSCQSGVDSQIKKRGERKLLELFQ